MQGKDWYSEISSIQMFVTSKDLYYMWWDNITGMNWKYKKKLITSCLKWSM